MKNFEIKTFLKSEKFDIKNLVIMDFLFKESNLFSIEILELYM